LCIASAIFRALSLNQEQYEKATICPLTLAQRFREKLGAIETVENLEAHDFDLVFPYLSDFHGDEKEFSEYAGYIVRLFDSQYESIDQSLSDLLEGETVLDVFEKYQKSLGNGEWPSYSGLYNFLNDLKKQRVRLEPKFEALVNEGLKRAVKDPFGVMSMLDNKLASDSRKWATNGCNIHSPYFALLGPSMAGKSFLLRQLSYRKDVYVVYICFRSPQSRGAPPSTPFLAKALGIDLDPYRATQVYLKFFVKIFEIIKADSSPDSSNFNRKWIDNDDAFLKEIWNCVKDLPEKEDRKKSDKTKNGKEKHLHEDLQKKIEKLWKEIVTSKPWLSKETPAIIFAFDEARILLNNNFDANVFLPLRSCLQIFPRNGKGERLKDDCSPEIVQGESLDFHVPISIFTDTIARLQNFWPVYYRDPSTRISNGSLELLKPFYRLKFVDIFQDGGIVTMSNLTTRSISSGVGVLFGEV
jgi:hypothetical protein